MTYTRISTQSLNTNIINNMLSNRSKLNELQEQISSGKKVNSVSDNPTAATTILNTNTTLNKLNLYSSNIDDAMSELDVTESAITGLVDIVQRANELAVQASNGTVGTDELAAINSEIEELIDQVKDLGNTQYGDKYLFGGLVTDQPPYEVVGTNIQYVGTPETGNYERSIVISEGVSVPINVTGDALIGECYYDAGPPIVDNRYGLLNTLENLSLALEANPIVYDDINIQIEELDNDLTNILCMQSEIGGLESRLELTQKKNGR